MVGPGTGENTPELLRNPGWDGSVDLLTLVTSPDCDGVEISGEDL